MTDFAPIKNAWRDMAGDRSGIAFGIPDSLDAALQGRLAKLRTEFAGSSRILARLDRPEFRDEERLRGWAGSRSALASVLERLISDGESPAAIRISLSHCADLTVAVASAGGFAGVGVDVERSDRSLTPAAVKRFVSASEEGLGLSALQIWVLKEAMFKADPENAGQVVANYRVGSRDGELSGSRANSQVRFRCRVLRVGEHHLGLSIAG